MKGILENLIKLSFLNRDDMSEKKVAQALIKIAKQMGDFNTLLKIAKKDKPKKKSPASKIKAKNPGITDLPDGAWKEWSVGKLVSHFKTQAKEDGKQAISRAVNNIARWNKKKDPSLSKKAKSVMEKLSKAWDKEK